MVKKMTNQKKIDYKKKWMKKIKGVPHYEFAATRENYIIPEHLMNKFMKEKRNLETRSRMVFTKLAKKYGVYKMIDSYFISWEPIIRINNKLK
jgi:hypothetical protein